MFQRLRTEVLKRPVLAAIVRLNSPPPSSSGLGHRVLSPKTGVRLPLGVLAALYFKGFMHIGPFLGHIWAILL